MLYKPLIEIYHKIHVESYMIFHLPLLPFLKIYRENTMIQYIKTDRKPSVNNKLFKNYSNVLFVLWERGATKLC